MKISDKAVKTINILNKIFFILCILAFIAGIAISSSGLKAQWFSPKNTNNNSNSGNHQDYGGGSYIPPTHTHNYTVYQVVNPTCTEKGYTVYYCSGCGGSYNGDYVAATGHTYQSKITNATCTEKGYTTYTCTRCNDSYKDNYVNATGHDYAAWKTTKVSTCTEKGEKTATCTRCTKTKTETIAATGHNYVKSGSPIKKCALSAVSQSFICSACSTTKTEKVDVQGIETPDIHKKLNENDTCEFCGWEVYAKVDDAVLMTDNKEHFSVEFYGTATYTFSQTLRKCITNVYIASSVASIGDYAFSHCSELKSVTIPDGVTSIGYAAFYGCSNLTSITIPDSITSIGYYAFYACNELKSVTIPEGVTGIADRTFSSCYNLTSITIPDSVTSIGDSAFESCSSLTSITIPDSVTSIERYAFNYCSSLTNIIFKGTKVQWNAINKGANWENAVPLNTVVHCTDGDVKIHI